MKKALLLLSFVHLLVACTNDIEVLPDDEPQKLIINAMMNAGSTDNAIFLALSGYRAPQVVKNGIIRLYINDVLSETVTECTHHSANDYESEYMDYFYQINSCFRTGDHIRIEVETKDGKYKANAETTVCEPIEIVRADTIATSGGISENEGYFLLVQYANWEIKLKAPSSSRHHYYRVEIKHDFAYHLVNRNTLQDSIVTSAVWECSGYYDTALMDGKPGNPNNNDPFINFIPTINNYHNVFSDAYFTDGQYTMALESYYTFGMDSKQYEVRKASGKYTIQYYAIPQNEYQYLKAANANTGHDSSDLLQTPVIFPTNVKGGIGIFTIENPTEYTINLME